MREFKDPSGVTRAGVTALYAYMVLSPADAVLQMLFRPTRSRAA